MSEEQLQETEDRVLGMPGAKAVSLSQRDYRPTPYRDANYEIVGERFDTVHFHPLELEIVPTDTGEPDPMFEDFGSGSKKTATHLHHSATGEAAAGDLEPEESVAPGMDPEELRIKLEEAFEQGRAQGFVEGEEEAKKKIEERYNDIQTRLDGLSDEIRAEFKNCLGRVEAQGASLALNVAKKILLTTAEVKPEYIFDVIRSGLKSLGGAQPIKVRLSTQDFEFIEVIGLPSDLTKGELGVDYVADEAIHSGCVIETNFGEVDLQLEKMWEQVRENLFGVRK